MKLWGAATLLGLLLFPACLSAADPFQTALQQAQAGRLTDAVTTLTSALKTTPALGADAYLLLSTCQMQLGQDDAALQSLRRGLAAYPAAAQLEKATGQLLFRQHFDSIEAGSLLGRAAKALPADAEVRHYYAQWAYLNSRDRVCVEQEQSALRLKNLNEAALLQMNTLLGMCGGRLEDASVAKSAFQAALDINLRQPSFDPIGAYQYVQFLARFADDAELQKVVDQILNRVPRFGPALLERAKSLSKSGDREGAIDAARRTLEGTNIDINTERAAHGILARSYVALGRTQEAEQEQAWIESHPNPETPQK